MADPTSGSLSDAGASIDPKASGAGSPTAEGYVAHPLERHVNTYRLNDSDLDLMEGSGPLFDFCLGIGLFFGSVAITCYLAGITLKQDDWTAQQYALFYYVPLGCLGLFVAATILAVITGVHRSKARKRIKEESYVPGTYVEKRTNV
jgi:hypothetical protein